MKYGDKIEWEGKEKDEKKGETQQIYNPAMTAFILWVRFEDKPTKLEEKERVDGIVPGF